FVPVTDRSGYGIAELTGESVIVTGRFNIREPINTEIIKGVLPKDTLSLVPGVAFGRDCGRIGYGGGYYDRLFLRYGLLAGFKIGLGFEFQIYESVPFEQHDIFLDMVITEQSVYQR
ncbi:MAG: 5-formyltetrahydrofolate cyclo-ligase, partial [Lentisphaerae bacterium]|nr:5-formyltetrahydrofolate cyclo-ligase [Lentisphaerota bacterium]